MKTHKAILLFGGPGVGKGTQGRILGAIPGYLHFSMGDAFRSLDPGSGLGAEIAGFLSRGELVPDGATIKLLEERVAQLEAEGAYRPGVDALVLDGVPRSVGQAELLDGKIDVVRVVHIDTDDEEAMVERLRRRAEKEGRADDARVEVIRNRLGVYRRETAPVLDHYPSEAIARVDALGAPAEVTLRVLRAVLGRGSA